jgi:hypothetical protein
VGEDGGVAPDLDVDLGFRIVGCGCVPTGCSATLCRVCVALQPNLERGCLSRAAG